MPKNELIKILSYNKNDIINNIVNYLEIKMI